MTPGSETGATLHVKAAFPRTDLWEKPLFINAVSIRGRSVRRPGNPHLFGYESQLAVLHLHTHMLAVAYPAADQFAG